MTNEDPYDLSEELNSLTDIQKIAVVQWAMKHIVNHAREGGSYRYLIYTRMGFGMEAYAPLCSDGLTISNEFDLGIKDAILDAYKSKDDAKMKTVLGLCDESDCLEYAHAGWPSKDGYRRTCTQHYWEKGEKTKTES